MLFGPPPCCSLTNCLSLERQVQRTHNQLEFLWDGYGPFLQLLCVCSLSMSSVEVGQRTGEGVLARGNGNYQLFRCCLVCRLRPRSNGHVQSGLCLMYCAFDSHLVDLRFTRHTAVLGSLSVFRSLARSPLSVLCFTCGGSCYPFIMLAPLPAPWTEEKDLKGRTYYSNHATKETTWEVSGKRESISRGGRGQQEALFFAPSQKRDVTEECSRHSQLPEKFRRILCISHQK